MILLGKNDMSVLTASLLDVVAALEKVHRMHIYNASFRNAVLPLTTFIFFATEV